MRRMLTLTLWLVCAGIAPAGDKVFEVVKELTIKDEIRVTDPRVKVLDVFGKDQQMPARVYAMKLQEGFRYQVTLKREKADFDPFLVIQDSKGKQLAFDDDGAGMLNSRLVFAPKDTGVYKVFAASLEGQPGAFTLTVEPIKATGFLDPKEHAVGKDGIDINGTLTKDKLSITYQVRLQKDKTYRLDMTSKEIDTFLTLRGPDGMFITENDDSGGTTNSRIVFRAPADGLYRFVAGSFSQTQTGDFSIQVRAE